MWAVVHCCIVHIFLRRSIIVWTKRRPGSRTRASCSFHAIAPLKRVEFLIKYRFWSWKNDVLISSAAWIPLYKQIFKFRDGVTFKTLEDKLR